MRCFAKLSSFESLAHFLLVCKARTVDEKEKWIRKVQLMVLLYEGIVSKAFNYDYAPQVQQVECRHCYMNVTQEGKDDIDDLREAYLIAAVSPEPL